MSTFTAEIERLFSAAEELKDTDAHVVSVMDVGDYWRQGDIYITRINKTPEEVDYRGFSKVCNGGELKLAEGDGEGSRHCVSAIADNCVFCNRTPDQQVGWIIVSWYGFTVTHPTHGDVTILEPGVYAVVFQRGLTLDPSGMVSQMFTRTSD